MEPTYDDNSDLAGLNRRALLRAGTVTGLGLLAASVPLLGRTPASAAPPAPGGPEPSAPELRLTKFKDPLRIPPVLRPRDKGDHDELTVRLVTADVTLHSELPPVPMWTYEGSYPGPTIATTAGRPLRVTWENRLTGGLPVRAVDFGAPKPSPDPLSNYPGTAGCQEVPGVADLPPWVAVHLHGMLTGGGNDGWMENLIGPGDVQLSAYPNKQAATTLWYHDHTHHVSRFTVYAGLAGLFTSRTEEERALGLPEGDRDVPLVLSDRNFDTDDAGNLLGRSVHKVEMVGPQRLMRAHAAPYTLVNGVVWPYLEVKPRAYRFRIVNAANSRMYRLMLLADGVPVPGALQVIATDHGLLDRPVAVEGALNLSPGERAEVVVDFSAFRGRTLKLVNTFQGVAPGASDRKNDLLEPDVMQFRVADRRPDAAYAPPAVLSSTFRRVGHEELPHAHAPRWVLIAGPSTSNVPEMWEMEEVDPAGLTFPTTGIVQITDAQGRLRTLRRTASAYDEGRAFTVAHGSVEIWNYLNLTGAPHPMHIHLAHFQVLSRDQYDVTGFDRTVRGTARPVAFKASVPLDAHETGEKDVVRVGTAGQIVPGPNGTPGELVSVAVRFPVVGRGVHHCHMLEHEQHMMRPLVVSPPAHLHAGGHH